ncbi:MULTISPECIES: hypothetical protein [unclassified Gilliamella]|uniref:hypothetical protein n=1 Tax=unclassified Gilliamella TaxID=2685620 RepID=UPI00159ED3CA|nr:hypothetical protein [Gilliamella apicola]
MPAPIGLVAGFKLYEYTPNGLTRVDHLGMNAHHIRQKAIMQNLVKGYDPCYFSSQS